MRLLPSLRPYLALLGIQIDKANIVSHFEAVQRCSVGRLLPPPPPREISGGSGEAAKLLYRGNKRERREEGGSRCCRCCAAVTASSVVARLESDERRTSHCPCPPSSTMASALESSEIVKACAGSQPPSCLRRLPWNRWSESIEIGSVVFREEIGELRATFSSSPFTVFICRVRRVACEASTHGYSDSFFLERTSKYKSRFSSSSSPLICVLQMSQLWFYPPPRRRRPN